VREVRPRRAAPIDYDALVREDRFHGSLYSDFQVFDDEMSRIFATSWVFVGHESEVPKPGDWVTRRIGREPVILVRNQDAEPQVLSNRCAHRGTTLCWDEQGRTRNFRCTYHAWSFDLDGVLLGVPYPGGFRGAKSDVRLDRPAQVAQYRGFVFARMAREGPSLDEFLGPAGRAHRSALRSLARRRDPSPLGLDRASRRVQLEDVVREQ